MLRRGMSWSLLHSDEGRVLSGLGLLLGLPVRTALLELGDRPRLHGDRGLLRRQRHKGEDDGLGQIVLRDEGGLRLDGDVGGLEGLDGFQGLGHSGFLSGRVFLIIGLVNPAMFSNMAELKAVVAGFENLGITGRRSAWPGGSSPWPTRPSSRGRRRRRRRRS